MPQDVILRPATIEDCPALTRLALASKAHWGYDEAFMQACVSTLTVTPALLAGHHVTVAEGVLREQPNPVPAPLGFYALSQDRPEAGVESCFVAPAAIRSGIGGLLWRDLEAFARTEAIASLVLAADPNAVGFYRQMGMEDAGFEPSNVFGPERPLPRLRKVLPA